MGNRSSVFSSVFQLPSWTQERREDQMVLPLPHHRRKHEYKTRCNITKFHLYNSNTLPFQLWMDWHQARSVHCLPTQMANSDTLFWISENVSDILSSNTTRYLGLVSYERVFSEVMFIYYLILHCPARCKLISQQTSNYVSLWCKNSSSGSGYDQGWDFQNQGLT